MTSTDGYTWTGRLSGNEGNQWCSVCWSADLNMFRGTHRVMISFHGFYWSAITFGNDSTNSWDSVKEIGLFTAVSNSGTHRVMTSPDSYSIN